MDNGDGSSRLVPRRRYRQFVRGVYRAHEDGRVV
jgi:hypothetical protein